MKGFAIVAGILCLAVCHSATATLYTITSNAGGTTPENVCTLVKAVTAANTNQPVGPCPAGSATEVDEIFLNIIGTVNLQSTLLVDEALILRGAGRGISRISGNNQRQIIRVNMTNADDDFVLEDLRIQQGRASSSSFAGAVQLMRGDSFHFTRTTFDGNATYFNSGGAIHAGPLDGITTASLRIEDSDFSNNYAEVSGGAIYTSGIGNDTNALQQITVTGSRFLSNTSEASGSAIFAHQFNQLIVLKSTFDDNTAGTSAAVSASHSSINQAPLVLLRRSTFANNTADGASAGIFISTGNLVIENSTFSGNTAMDSDFTGAAIYAHDRSTVSMFYNTLHDNSEGRPNDASLFACPDCEVTFRGNIIYSEPTEDSDCVISNDSLANSLGYNLDGDGSCFDGADDLVPQPPLLLALGNHAGVGANIAALTMPPRSSSVVVDAGEVNTCRGILDASIGSDQREYSRPVVGTDGDTARCDIGAVEYQPGIDEEDGLLSLSVSSGNGTIVVQPIDEQCSSNCNYLLSPEAEIEITATADPGFVFSGFTGDCSGSEICYLEMDEDRDVAATFTATQHLLSVSTTGSGTVTSSPSGIQCPGDCDEYFAVGETVSLSAVPASGWEFDEWEGACIGDHNCQFEMNQDKSVIAKFRESTAFLLVNVSGGARVTSQPAGIDCPGDCSETLPANTQVTLTATPLEGWSFDRWQGDCSGTENTCELLLTGDHLVYAFMTSADRLFGDRFESAAEARHQSNVP